MAVSKALLINGILVPNAALALAFEITFGFVSAAAGVVSAARSHDPISWERATEKNRNIGMVFVDPTNNQIHP